MAEDGKLIETPFLESYLSLHPSVACVLWTLITHRLPVCIVLPKKVLVSQPTHPAFYEDDVRHHKCNVCLQEYTCPPPTRGELMESFTGPEIAALLMTDRIICSRDIFSNTL